ncbi:nucleosidase, partial [Corynebacterium diphtheriae]
MAWLGLAGVGGRWWARHPRSPPKRRHFTPNLLK